MFATSSAPPTRWKPRRAPSGATLRWSCPTTSCTPPTARKRQKLRSKDFLARTDEEDCAVPAFWYTSSCAYRRSGGWLVAAHAKEVYTRGGRRRGSDAPQRV